MIYIFWLEGVDSMCKYSQELVGILDKSIKILNIETKKIKGKTYKFIHLIKTTKTAKCPHCNKSCKILYGKRITSPTHLKQANFPTKVILTKRRFLCNHCKKVFTEQFNFILNKKRISNDVNKKILLDLKENLSIKYIANCNNVSRTHVLNLMKQYINYEIQTYNLPKVLSFDEFKADTDEGKYAFVMNDPINKCVINILPTREKQYLINFFLNCKNRDNVKYIIGDMYEPYLVITKYYFKNASYVVDRFHYIRYIMNAIDNVRIKYQKHFLSQNNIKYYNTLKKKKYVSLLRIYSPKVDWFGKIKICYSSGNYIEKFNYEILNTIFDIAPDLKTAYHLKEEFLDIINTSSFSDAEFKLKIWIQNCENSKLEEFISASSTIRNWLPYICNSFIDKRFSNGFTEGLNNRIKVHKRVAFGYKNFYIFRNRLLYMLGKPISISHQKNVAFNGGKKHTKNTKY